MINYFLQRLLTMSFIVFLVITITFFIAHWLPGDPTALWVGPHPTEQQLEIARKTLGLDESLAKQYCMILHVLTQCLEHLYDD